MLLDDDPGRTPVTVDLPADVVAWLGGSPDPSAVVAAALRSRMERAATTETVLRAVGFDLTAQRRAAVRRKAPAPSGELRAAIARRRELLLADTRRVEPAP